MDWACGGGAGEEGEGKRESVSEREFLDEGERKEKKTLALHVRNPVPCKSTSTVLLLVLVQFYMRSWLVMVVT